MDSNSNGNILCSIKWHHGVRIGPHATKGIKEILEEQLVIIGMILGTNFILLMSPDIILIYGRQFCLQLVMVLCGHL